MNHPTLLLLSVAVGVMVVIQGGMNSRLGVLLDNSLLATSVALVTGASLTLIVVFLSVRQLPQADQLRSIPSYLWFGGGVLSFLAVTLFYYLIPRLGISTAVTFGLTGQIIFAAIAAHYGWFGMPVEVISVRKIIGMAVLIMGLMIIKY